MFACLKDFPSCTWRSSCQLCLWVHVPSFVSIEISHLSWLYLRHVKLLMFVAPVLVCAGCLLVPAGAEISAESGALCDLWSLNLTLMSLMWQFCECLERRKGSFMPLVRKHQNHRCVEILFIVYHLFIFGLQGIIWPQVIIGVFVNVFNAIINYIFLHVLDMGIAWVCSARS